MLKLYLQKNGFGNVPIEPIGDTRAGWIIAKLQAFERYLRVNEKFFPNLVHSTSITSENPLARSTLI